MAGDAAPLLWAAQRLAAPLGEELRRQFGGDAPAGGLHGLLSLCSPPLFVNVLFGSLLCALGARHISQTSHHHQLILAQLQAASTGRSGC